MPVSQKPRKKKNTHIEIQKDPEYVIIPKIHNKELRAELIKKLNIKTPKGLTAKVFRPIIVDGDDEVKKRNSLNKMLEEAHKYAESKLKNKFNGQIYPYFIIDRNRNKTVQKVL